MIKSTQHFLDGDLEKYDIDPINQLYYQRYPFRINIDIYSSDDFKTVKTTCSKVLNFHRTYHDRRNGSCRIYLDTREDVFKILEKLDYHVLSISGPRSKEELDLIKTKKVIFRKKLWYNKYSYKVDIKANDWKSKNGDDLYKILSGVKDLANDIDIRSGDGFYFYDNYDKGRWNTPLQNNYLGYRDFTPYQCTFYINDVEELLFLKLKMPSNYKLHITEIMLK